MWMCFTYTFVRKKRWVKIVFVCEKKLHYCKYVKYFIIATIPNPFPTVCLRNDKIWDSFCSGMRPVECVT